MGLRRRKLLSKDDDDDLKEFCKDKCSSYLPAAACPSDCHSKCLYPCTGHLAAIPLPDHPDPPSKSSHRKLPTLLTSTIALLSFTFLFVLCYAIYAKFYAGRRGRRRRREPDPPPAVTQEEFLDEEQGPVVDHPIWYIRTVGLQPSVINAITVCKFKSGEGLIDGTECSVCLSEFEEDETLRLLPKCSHAFHLPCIDTWLRSHTNCPMCRAPILIQPTAMAAPSLESSAGSGSGQPEETTQTETLQNPNESRRDQEEEDDGGLESISVEDELRCPDEDSNEGLSDIQPMRRSVSLDSLSALGISSALAFLHLQPQEKADAEGELGEKKENNNNPKKSQLRGHHRPATMNRSVSCSGKFLLRSSTQRSINGVDDHS